MTERKNHIPPYMVSKNLSVCLSIRLLQTLTPIISGIANQNELNFFRMSMAESDFSKNLFVRKMASRARAKGQNSNILTQYLSCLTWNQAEISKIVHLYLIFFRTRQVVN